MTSSNLAFCGVQQVKYWDLWLCHSQWWLAEQWVRCGLVLAEGMVDMYLHLSKRSHVKSCLAITITYRLRKNCIFLARDALSEDCINK